MYPKKANMDSEKQRAFPNPLHCGSAADARGFREISIGMSRLWVHLLPSEFKFEIPV